MTDAAMAHMHGEMVAMALSGGMVALLVPGALLMTRSARAWSWVTLPAAVALPLFLVLHGVVTLLPEFAPVDQAERWVLESALVCGAFLFWLPVLGTRRPLSGAGRCLYLFLAAPVLDLPAVFMISRGHTAGGIAMMVTMLPIGFAALVLTWRWIVAEERAEQAAAPRRAGVGAPAAGPPQSPPSRA
ncbi:hypothetical protein [Streptomyces montanisoli]|uniref:Uncharacterized protein n=1 Tax=Streptomyces montanisoli TaxID=2798581 RepID=A0A940MDT0_9ACTN|nr:hypothetical protein [Streptomyces montanisoli]MBP0456843.1 hypothetical protein [Streptomyces montanisoli]